MLFGHIGVVAACRSVASQPNSTSWFVALAAAAYVPDFLDVAIFASGICSPFGLYSHTLQALILEAAVVGGIVWLLSRSYPLTALFLVVVLLHLPSDFFTGRKLFLAGGELHGLRLYKKPVIDFTMEVSIMAAGWWLLRRSGKGPAWTRSVKTLALFAFLQLAANLAMLVLDVPLKPEGCTGASAAIS